MTQTLSALVHGEPGVGKTRLFATAPGRKLLLDVEGGSRFIRGIPRIEWDPLMYAPPEIGDWELCVVYVRDWRTLTTVDQWLQDGRHPFEAAAMDTLTEAQKRLVDQTAGLATPTQAQWGDVLRNLEDMMRRWRDLTFHPTNPLSIVTVLCHSHYRDERFRPWVKGQLELSLPGFFDVVGYMDTVIVPEQRLPQRRMLIAPVGPYIAKDRTGVLTEHYGPTIPNPNIPDMLRVIYPQEVPAP